MNQSPDDERQPAPQPDGEQPIIINIDQRSIANAIKGFLLGYFGVIAFTLIFIALCWLTLIITGLLMRS